MFDSVRDLAGIGPEILMVPLLGHTLGHAGVAVREDTGWLLLAGDAYFDHDELDSGDPRCTPGLRFYQWMMERTAGCGSRTRSACASSCVPTATKCA